MRSVSLISCFRVWATLAVFMAVGDILQLRPGLLPTVVEAKSNKTDLEILDGLLKNYDRRATPTPQKDQPTIVECDLYIRSFGSINPNTMDYEVDAYLRQEWTDARLNHSEIREPMDLNDPELVKAIWKPEVYFPNAKQATFQFVTVPNVLIRINPNGRILYMLRLKLTFSCMMELSKYPLDMQICTMEIASFSKTLKELHITWKNSNPIKLYSGLRMPQFSVEHVNTNICQESFQIGNYSCLKAEYHLKRAVGFHLVQSYLPTMLIVVISWVSFWMDVDSVPGRTTLGVTTLLTMSTKASGVQMEIPQVSYVKAIDVWMGACTAFIFAALLEFTLVNYFYRQDLSRAEKHQEELDAAALVQTSGLVGPSNNGAGRVGNNKGACNAGDSTGNGRLLAAGDETSVGTSEIPDFPNDNGFIPNILLLQNMPTRTFQPISRLNMRAHQIDECCRFIFPVLFSMFNFSYWTYYLFVA